MDERSLNDDPISKALGLQQSRAGTRCRNLPHQGGPMGGRQRIGQGLNADRGKPFAGSPGQESLATLEAVLQDAQHPLLLAGDGGQAFVVHGPQQVSLAIQDGHQFALSGQKVVEQGRDFGFER
jgi:hypothetical protein